MFWNAKSEKELVKAVMNALDENLKYSRFMDKVMGFPGSYLDTNIFSHLPTLNENSSLKEAYLRVSWENPNHIGCHTLGESTPEFTGTHRIEKELLHLCAEEILCAKKEEWDGYVSSGGTEANILAMWIFRNIWLENNSGSKKEYHSGQVHILSSIDAHYSIEKGANLLGISSSRVEVDVENDRQIDLENLIKVVSAKKFQGIKKFLIVLNMGSTNFGSVDNIDRITEVLDREEIYYEIHIDAAFGGFIYPFTNPSNNLTFANPKIISFTLDAHKMLQAPYGTGIFLTRKDRIKKINTKSATYIQGSDNTVCGSRSGANSIVIWMILKTRGSEGEKEFCKCLISNTDYLCSELIKLNIKFYRNQFMNVVAIDSNGFSEQIAIEYHLQADDYDKKQQKWWRVVVMQHVSKEMIDGFLEKIKNS